MLYFYRSAAGSGKTHTLVYKYLRLAFLHPLHFKKILAITFTNKAMQEMKQRILFTLHCLSNGSNSAIMSSLISEGWSIEKIQKKATITLSNILHQYDHFSVSTIDSFFQKIIHAFAKEIGLQNGFSIEMDQKLVVDKISDQLISTIGNNTEIQNWLIAFAKQQLLQGKAWHIHQSIHQLGTSLFLENFQEKEIKIRELLTNLIIINNFKKKIQFIIANFEESLQKWGKEAIYSIKDAGLQIEDFSYGKNGVAGYFNSIINNASIPTQRVYKALDNIEAWYSKKSNNKEKIIQITKKILQKKLYKVINFYEKFNQTYHTALAVKPLLHAFGIITQLFEQLSIYRSERNVMLISDTALLLKRIIDENDAPFIYEKIGNWYQHFLIDELQDISKFQWQNLKSLIANGLADGHESLFVGDVKQSIYRWRGSDSELMNTKILQEIGIENSKVLHLRHNWRSKQHIIHFNNNFFSQSVQLLSTFLQKKIGIISNNTALHKNIIKQIKNLEKGYQKVEQYSAANNKNDQGYLSIQFIDTDDWEKKVCEKIPTVVEKLQDQAINLNDVAILVRNNIEAEYVLTSLLSYKQSSKAKKKYRYEAVTKSSYCIGDTIWISLIIHALRYLINEKDIIAQTTLAYLYQKYIKKNESNESLLPEKTINNLLPKKFIEQKINLKAYPLYECTESLIRIFSLSSKESISFLETFQDLVLQFTKKEPESTIKQFLTWWKTVGYYKKSPSSTNQNALQIITIHQAKGLQFRTIIIPFCNWSLDHPFQKSPILWCEHTHAPFNSFPALPINYSKRLAETDYAQYYYQEYCNIHFDHFNLFYVACTRAIEQLYIFAPYTQQLTDSTCTNIAHLLQKIVTSDNAFLQKNAQKKYINTWSNYWNNETKNLIIGKKDSHNIQYIKKNDELELYSLYQWTSEPFRTKLPLYYDDASMLTKHHHKQKNYELIIHQILANIEHIDALEKTLAMHNIDTKQMEHIQKMISRLWLNPQILSWFNGIWPIKKEATILLPTGKLIRPDRVMIKNRQAIVVDFKSTHTAANPQQHFNQMHKYVEALQKMDYKNVEAYLLYVETAEIIHI